MNALTGAKRQQRGSKHDIRTPPSDIVLPNHVKMQVEAEKYQKYLKEKKAEIERYNESIGKIPDDLKAKKLLGNFVWVKLFKLDMITSTPGLDGKPIYSQKTIDIPIQADGGTKMVEVPNPLPYLYAGCIHGVGNLVQDSYGYLKKMIGAYVEIGHEVDLQRSMYYLRKNETDKEPNLDDLQQNNHEVFRLWQGYVKIAPSAIESEIPKNFYKWKK